VLRKIYGPVYDNGIWRIMANKELMALYQELEIVAEIKKARLRLLGHVERMLEDRVIKKLYMSKSEGRSVGR
jgi:16S rRNA C1402 N4-methylase RsmH